ncbi:hypothetical protein C8J56DRAFT_1043886 [Mycena floridula]|nr:hypothetical protein C8J56DRAFT_1043886 [Mycena floridula]
MNVSSAPFSYNGHPPITIRPFSGRRQVEPGPPQQTFTNWDHEQNNKASFVIDLVFITGVDSRQHALFVLKHKGIPFPDSPEDSLDTPESLKAELERKKKSGELGQDLNRLFDFHSALILKDSEQLYQSKDPSQLIGDQQDASDVLYNSHCDQARSTFTYYARHRLTCVDDIDRFRYRHANSVCYLNRRMNTLREKQIQEQRRIEAQFPQTVEEFFTKKDHIQRHIAEMLTQATAMRKTRIMSMQVFSLRGIFFSSIVLAGTVGLPKM